MDFDKDTFWSFITGETPDGNYILLATKANSKRLNVTVKNNVFYELNKRISIEREILLNYTHKTDYISKEFSENVANTIYDVEEKQSFKKEDNCYAMKDEMNKDFIINVDVDSKTINIFIEDQSMFINYKKNKSLLKKPLHDDDYIDSEMKFDLDQIKFLMNKLSYFIENKSLEVTEHSYKDKFGACLESFEDQYGNTVLLKELGFDFFFNFGLKDFVVNSKGDKMSVESYLSDVLMVSGVTDVSCDNSITLNKYKAITLKAIFEEIVEDFEEK